MRCMEGDVYMSIAVINEQGGGGGAATAFSDNFNRANNVNGFGENWICAGLNYTIAASFSQIGPVGISANQAVWQATAVSQNIINMPHGFMPVPVMSGLNGKNQFSQFRFVSTNSVQGTRILYIGPTVLNGWVNGGFRHYIAVCLRDDVNSIFTINIFDGSAYQVIPGIGNAAMADGDIIRLEARIASGGGSVELRGLRNGTQVLSGTDSSASRSITGSPGMHRPTYITVLAPGTSTVVCDDYACGRV